MGAINPYKRFISSFILLMMVAAFALKAIIPAGFMPETKNGFVEMVICSGMDMKTVLVPSDQLPPSEHQKDKPSQEICAYQILASGKILIPSPVLALLVPDTHTLPPLAAPVSVLVSPYSLSFDARGPPAA